MGRARAPIMNELCKLLQHFPDKPWDWNCLSENPNINMEFALSHSCDSWNWDCLSKNPSITMKDVFTHPDKHACWIKMAQRPF
jgi:hypothetical protein